MQPTLCVRVEHTLEGTEWARKLAVAARILARTLRSFFLQPHTRRVFHTDEFGIIVLVRAHE